MDYKNLNKKYNDTHKVDKEGILVFLLIASAWAFFVMCDVPFYPMGMVLLNFSIFLLIVFAIGRHGLQANITVSEKDAPPADDALPNEHPLESESMQEIFSRMEETSQTEDASSCQKESHSTSRQYSIHVEKPSAKTYGKYDPAKTKAESDLSGCILVILILIGAFMLMCFFAYCMQ